MSTEGRSEATRDPTAPATVDGDWPDPRGDALNWADALAGGGLLVALRWRARRRRAADDGRLDWPLRPRPAVVRAFDAPSPNWQRGHRGVDLAGAPGQPVYAAGPGDGGVRRASWPGRPVVSMAHPGGLRTSYEPVRAAVRAGQLVDAGDGARRVGAGHPGCAAPACLHWGAMWGPAARRRLRRSRWGCWHHADPAQAAAAVGRRPTRAGGTSREGACLHDTPDSCVQLRTLAAVGDRTCP